MSEPKTHRVILGPDQAMVTYNQILTTTAMGREEKDLAAADAELGKIVRARQSDDLNGNVQFQRPDDIVEADFSFKAMRGFKTVFVQAIAGFGQIKSAASYGFKTYTLIPIVEAFGKKMVEMVEKETKSEMGNDEEVDWNDETSKEDAEENVEFDGDGEGEAEAEPSTETPGEEPTEK